MAWKRKYPDYPDLTGEALGDFRARLARLNTPYDDVQSDERHGLYMEDVKLYWASMLRHFVDCVDSEQPIERWVLTEFSRAFSGVLAGTVWEDSIPLPGRVFKDEWYAISPKDRKDAKLCIAVRSGVRFGEKVTEAIASVAADNNCSFEKVRAAYYKWNKYHEELAEESKKMAQSLEDEKS